MGLARGTLEKGRVGVMTELVYTQIGDEIASVFSTPASSLSHSGLASINGAARETSFTVHNSGIEAGVKVFFSASPLQRSWPGARC
jgi:hypothetical protein